jgi:hypothetical protein
MFKSQLFKFAICTHFYAWKFLRDDRPVVLKPCIWGPLHPDEVFLMDVLAVGKDDILVAS